MADRAEEQPLEIVGEARALDIRRQVGLEVVMAGYFVALAAPFSVERRTQSRRLL